MTKRCSKCGDELPIEQFPRHKGCADGHLSWCKSCERKVRARWLARPGVREDQAIKDRARRNIEHAKDMNLRRVYGISFAQFVDMLEGQNYACPICASELDGGRHTHVDHCHETGVVRALLCGSCNMGLGCMGDDPTRLRAAADYVYSHNTPRLKADGSWSTVSYAKAK